MLNTIKTKQFIKGDINSIWAFMSSPENLALITPNNMNFNIISDRSDLGKMYEGQIIEYYLKPFAGIRMYWVSEITYVQEKKFFVDEQRVGPYTFWHHKHFLREVEGGVEMTDIVHYKVPFGFLGRIANALFIKNQLKTIFEYRFNKIDEIFNRPD